MAPDDLGFFRVEIEMALEGPVEIASGDEETPNVVNGYYQLFGVTASSYAEAVAFVEKTLAIIVTEGPETFGWLVQLQVDTWSDPTADADGEFLQDPLVPGLHFISDRAYFLALEEEPEA